MASCFKCPNCGIEIYTLNDNTSCPYCNSSIGEDNLVLGLSMPDLYLPFRVSRKTAEKAVKKFLVRYGLCITPYLSGYRSKLLKGLYIPCSELQSTFTGIGFITGGYDIDEAVLFSEYTGDYDVVLGSANGVYCPVWLYMTVIRGRRQYILVNGFTGELHSSLKHSYYNLLSFSLILQILCVFTYYLATIRFGIKDMYLNVLWFLGVLFFIINFVKCRRICI